MVVGAFPAAKLGALLVKQISKPIANAIKTQAKSTPIFRKYVCMPPAQFYNWCEVKAKMWILNLGKPVNIPVLNEAMAIELGANLLGEAIIFIIAAGILISEYNRSLRKEAAKEQAIIDEKENLQRTMRDLFFLTEQQAAEIREIKTFIYDLESKVVFKPWANKQHTKPTDPSPPPPPPSSEPSGDTNTNEQKQEENDLDNKFKPECDETQHMDKENGLILRAVVAVENEFWKSENKPREESILTLAINHFYKNIYKTHLSL